MPEGENGAKWTESQTKVLPYETYAHVAGRGWGCNSQRHAVKTCKFVEKC